MVTNMAMNMGADIMKQKQKEVEGMVEKYISVGQLKYYFAVDNTYVTKKLMLLLFPFTHNDWSIRYNHDEPVQPRFELNAADLYIPSMAFVTYILVVGYMLGMQDRFAPDLLATTGSSSLTMLVLELLVIYLTTTIMNIQNGHMCVGKNCHFGGDVDFSGCVRGVDVYRAALTADDVQQAVNQLDESVRRTLPGK